MKKLRKQAKELFQLATKVYNYRRDVLPENRITELEKAVREADAFYKRNDPNEETAFQASLQRLDALLLKIGGKIYPKTFWNDNIEVALVAAILVIGVRTFFFQPFIIPTNSMYPTYSGMNAVIYEEGEPSPSGLKKLFNLGRLGAKHFEVRASSSGRIRIPVFSQAQVSPDARLRNGGLVRYKEVKGRKWFGILPALKREYTFYVDEQPVTLRVPAEFPLDDVIRQSFFPQEPSLREVMISQHEGGLTNVLSPNPILETSQSVQAGERVLEFDITLGDALFVDRLTYHFRRPRAGDPFVFRTRTIPGIEGGPNTYVDKYYIKRIGGVGGETLEIKDSALLVDGMPRDEVEAFGRNAVLEGEYGGYINGGLLAAGRKLSIPENNFVALGDNSGNSLDSRFWGFVPDDTVIGKAIFIYYPFTKRWGLAE